MRLVAERTLGKYYSYGLKTSGKHELVKHGIYKYVRHPIYFSMLLYNDGIPLLFSSLYGLLLMQAFIPLVLYRIKIEEDMLIKKFGDEYCEYMKRTKNCFLLSIKKNRTGKRFKLRYSFINLNK
jgi:protein-S-isoprenylcysteine O-methyltransferase Ste14